LKNEKIKMHNIKDIRLNSENFINLLKGRNSDIDINDYTKIEIYFDDILIFKDGEIYANYNEEMAKKYLKNKNLIINIVFNTGNNSSTVWTTDLSYDYIKINADYRT